MIQTLKSKIQNWEQAAQLVQTWQSENQKVVFTNGCFDILHYGHLHYLADAKMVGDKLAVGLNSDGSVQRLKGNHRPINDLSTRLHMLAALEMVDMVVIFEEDTPFQLIQKLQPDFLVKGGDYQPKDIVGADIVLAKGGQVLSLPFVKGYSTTKIEDKIKNG